MHLSDNACQRYCFTTNGWQSPSFVLSPTAAPSGRVHCGGLQHASVHHSTFSSPEKGRYVRLWNTALPHTYNSMLDNFEYYCCASVHHPLPPPPPPPPLSLPVPPLPGVDFARLQCCTKAESAQCREDCFLYHTSPSPTLYTKFNRDCRYHPFEYALYSCFEDGECVRKKDIVFVCACVHSLFAECSTATMDFLLAYIHTYVHTYVCMYSIYTYGALQE